MRKNALAILGMAILMIMATGLPAFAVVLNVDLPRTGQVWSYDANTTQKDDGAIQAGVVWPAPRFVIGADAEIDCVTDNLTGLMWARNANIPENAMLWQEALDYVAAINSGSGLCGHNDWRLPNINELESLVNAGQANSYSWLNTQGFADVQPDYYWSSSTCAGETGVAWSVNMWGGGIIDNPKSLNYYLLPVRSGQPGTIQLPKTGQAKCYNADGEEIPDCSGTGQDGDIKAGVAWPDPRFTDHGDGSVTDNLTGLMWLKDANCINTNYSDFDGNDETVDGKVPWQDALNFVQGINAATYSNCSGGHNDWRLPNRKELLSLIDYSAHDPALLSGHPFINVQSPRYVSSSAWTPDTAYVWYVYMYNGPDTSDSGSVDFNSKDESYYVWPVRAGHIDGTIICNFYLSPGEISLTKTGGNGIVEVIASSQSCNWTALSNDAWITITEGDSGTGDGTVNYSVAAYADTDDRTGTITVAGQTFTVTQYGNIQETLNVTKTGTGTGTVTIDDINCGSDCIQSYDKGTGVTLTATASDGSGFIGWTGACASFGNTCTVSMLNDEAVSAEFAHLITVGEGADSTALTWTTGGNANWLGFTNSSLPDGDAARSGIITDDQASWIETKPQ